MALVLGPLPAYASFLTQEDPALDLPLGYCDNCDFQALGPEEHGYPAQ